MYAEVAQLVEHIPEEDGVGGSSPPLGTRESPPNGGFSIVPRESCNCLQDVRT